MWPTLKGLNVNIIKPPQIFPRVSLNANPKTIPAAPRNALIEDTSIPKKPISK